MNRTLLSRRFVRAGAGAPISVPRVLPLLLLAVLAIAVPLLAAGCAPAPTPDLFPHDAEDASAGPFDDAEALLRHLSEAGWDLPVPQILEYDWFDVPGLTFALNEDASNALIIHSYPSADAAKAATETLASGAQLAIMPDGQKMNIAWPDAPHVYLHGPLLVVYVGGEGDIMHLLTLALGAQVEGPAPPPGVGVR